MNFDGIKFTIYFENLSDKKNFSEFISNLDIVRTNIKFGNTPINKNKQNLKFYAYKLKHECTQPYNKYILKEHMGITKNPRKLIKNTTFEQHSFCDIGINNLGPDILTIKETNTHYVTLNFKNIIYEARLKNNNLSLDEILFFKKFYTDKELLIKKRFFILQRVFEYISKNNLQFNTKIKEIIFSYYDFSNNLYKLFNVNKKFFIHSNYSLNIKKYYFDYPLIYNKDYDKYLKDYVSICMAFDCEKDLIIKEYDTFDRFRFITTNKEKKFLKIDKKIYHFKPLIDKESSYIKINSFFDSKISFTNRKLNNSIIFPQEQFQIIKVKISGWFTQNKKILESKNGISKYYYKLNEPIDEILEHINNFTQKYSIYKIKNKEEFDSLKNLVESKDKISKPLLKKFENHEDVEILKFSKALSNLDRIFNKN
jgi:hypothetical protein